MPEESLDADKMLVLGDWAQGLRLDDRPEVAAAGRAILMLVDEVERLHVLLWNQRLETPAPEGAEAQAASAYPDGDGERPIRERLLGRWRDTPSLE